MTARTPTGLKCDRKGPCSDVGCNVCWKDIPPYNQCCNNPKCSVSTGIHDGLTFGSGKLDLHGFWSRPCAPCARAWEAKYPEDWPCWPFEKQSSGDT